MAGQNKVFLRESLLTVPQSNGSLSSSSDPTADFTFSRPVPRTGQTSRIQHITSTTGASLDQLLRASAAGNAGNAAPGPTGMRGSPLEEHEEWVEDGEEEEELGLTFRESLYCVLEEPHSSNLANAWSLVMLGLIAVSVIQIVLESVQYISSQPYVTTVFFFVDTVVTSVFSIDYFGRMFVSPDGAFRFFFKAMNVIDLFSILPYFIEIGFLALEASDDVSGSSWSALQVFRILRLLRIFRVLKLGKRSLLFRLFCKALVNGWEGIAFLGFVVGLLVVFFSTLMFTAETLYCNNEEGKWRYSSGVDFKSMDGITEFQNIPSAMWWCIVTLSTVGYGDMFPKTLLGRLVATLTMIAALVVIAFPVTVLGQAFLEAVNDYNRSKMTATATNAPATTMEDEDDTNTLGRLHECLKELQVIRNRQKAKEREQIRLLALLTSSNQSISRVPRSPFARFNNTRTSIRKGFKSPRPSRPSGSVSGGSASTTLAVPRSAPNLTVGEGV